ncbi:unnamed protein product [Urochloa humidicola]
MSAPTAMEIRGRGFPDDGVLPNDAIYEILLRVPARPLCRFRAVCQSWRSLLSDPPFAAAHAARHRGDPPLFTVCAAGGTHGEVAEINLLDTSGRAVKRVSARHSSLLQQMLPHLHLVLLVDHDVFGGDTMSVLDPATGAVSLLPDSKRNLSSTFVLGRAVSSTGGNGEYKVLILDSSPHNTQPCRCRVLTVGGSTWRDAPGPPAVGIKAFRKGTTVVAQGIVYHLVDNPYGGLVAAFDLETERWWPRLVRGPARVSSLDGHPHQWRSLAELNGRLAAVATTVLTMDIWMLMGSGAEALWCKQSRVSTSSIYKYHGSSIDVKPLSVLEDGKVALLVSTYYTRIGALWIYDPMTKTCTHVVVVGNCLEVGVGVYTGNLLRQLQPAHGMEKL